MKIERLKVRNFKSFKHLDCKLSDFNVLIGPNASGKSNFVSIFKFLRDISKEGLINAISLQGGPEYIFNINSTRDESLQIEVYIDSGVGIGSSPPTIRQESSIYLSNLVYKLELQFYKSSPKLKKFAEEVSLTKRKVSDRKTDPQGLKSESEVILIRNVQGKLSYEGNLGELLETMIFRGTSSDGNFDGSLLNLFPITIFIQPNVGGLFDPVQVYDFDPKLSKKAIPLSGLAELESDGRNSALILKRLLESKPKKERFIRLLKTCLPFVERMEIENLTDSSILFKIAETYNTNRPIPSPLISDGTIELVSMIYALYFDNKKVVIMEEPERNIHPHIVSRLIELIKDASKDKQIILTTHSPEVLKTVNLEDVITLKRDTVGNSLLEKIKEKKDILLFLQDQIGIEDIFTDGILN